MKKPRACSLFTLLLLLFNIKATAQENWQLVSPSHVPEAATFWILSWTNSPPIPFNPWPGCNVYSIGDQQYVVDDLAVAAAMALLAESQTMEEGDPPPPPGGGGTNDTSEIEFKSLILGSNDLWLELTNVDYANQIATPRLHGTIANDTYQLLSQTNLAQPLKDWIQGEIISGATGTNVTPFSSVSIAAPSTTFYRAHHANQVVGIYANLEAVEPDPVINDPGQVGTFDVLGSGLTSDLTVQYTIGGTAINGIDYTNITGVVTLDAITAHAVIYIDPTNDLIAEGIETVELRIVPTNSFLISPGAGAATNVIKDVSMIVRIYRAIDAIEPDGPPGQPGRQGLFVAEREDSRQALEEITVPYVITGVAQNGVDYTNLPGTFTFTNGFGVCLISVDPVPDTLVEGAESVIMTLVASNGYVIDEELLAATNYVRDSSTVVAIFALTNAVETNVMSTIPGRVGSFEVTRDDRDSLFSSPLTIGYTIGGTAQNGVDYTNLSGTLTFASEETNALIYVDTISDDILEGDETVTLTLFTLQDSYMISTDALSGTITIRDNVPLVPVLTNILGPVGLDYHGPSNSIIISYNYDTGMHNFAQVYTNLVGGVTNVVVTNWSGVMGVGDEVHFTTAKANSGGFTNGDTFFASDTGIGYLSADGTRSNLNWCILTNQVVTNALQLRGSLYVDRTGTFSNQLIAVASNGRSEPGRKGVWRVDSLGHPTLLTNLLTPHLEGVITLTNDVQRWGPWAGKILTGDEDFQDTNGVFTPLIYTVDANGMTQAYNTTNLIPGGIHPEDFDIIPPNQSLYMCDFDRNMILKLSASYLTNYVGDLLITDAGESTGQAYLFILHWDSGTTNFTVRRVAFRRPDFDSTHFEHVTFAPIELPKK